MDVRGVTEAKQILAFFQKSKFFSKSNILIQKSKFIFFKF